MRGHDFRRENHTSEFSDFINKICQQQTALK